MLMILEHYIGTSEDIEKELYVNKIVLDISAEFYNFLQYETKSGKKYCAVQVNSQSGHIPCCVHIYMLGTIEQVVDTINKTIAEVKRRYP